MENRDRVKNICLLGTTSTQRKRREEEVKKDMCWQETVVQEDRKIKKLNVQGECHIN